MVKDSKQDKLYYFIVSFSKEKIHASYCEKIK